MAKSHWLNVISTCLSRFCLPKSKHWIRDEKLKCVRYQRRPTSSVSSALGMTISRLVILVTWECATDTKLSTRTVMDSVIPSRLLSEATRVREGIVEVYKILLIDCFQGEFSLPQEISKKES